ncbi:hypothetical protein J5N97_018437 [Dioscorea zingiberensis]|uniref:Uncharacterized protein n=1 Tax=Dioscorea zingiberensis TaxID=325984 RepID=A0A9D5HHM4_9LILI|nr:hypothetical protein J5N97_018437 [Dioscorea zingiberensis]
MQIVRRDGYTRHINFGEPRRKKPAALGRGRDRNLKISGLTRTEDAKRPGLNNRKKEESVLPGRTLKAPRERPPSPTNHPICPRSVQKCHSSFNHYLRRRLQCSFLRRRRRGSGGFCCIAGDLFTLR